MTTLAIQKGGSMANDEPSSGSYRESRYNGGSARGYILHQFARAGPWALLAIILIGGIGYELHNFVSIAGPAVTDYVTASRRIDEKNAENVGLLTQAQQRVSSEHESMLAGIVTLQQAIEQRHTEHTEQTRTINELLALITTATQTMSIVPQQRAEQLALLQQHGQVLEQIKLRIEELRASVEAQAAEAIEE